jgi:hypothetical protein
VKKTGSTIWHIYANEAEFIGEVNRMAFPAEFRYVNEDDFIQRFLIPLLQRLGFSLVVNYHGSSELGKDLIFAEVDRFGHVRYHGLQAKYEPSISLNQVESLISDCRQAFANPFTHPQTGTVERISSFYAVNGGSLGSEAVTHYFNSLRPSFGGNVQMLQGKDLLSLDRWASVNQVNSVGNRVAGLLLEIRYNRDMLFHISDALRQNVNRPLERFRIDASAAYLCCPALPNALNVDAVNSYWHLCAACNKTLDFSGSFGVGNQNQNELTQIILEKLCPNIDQLGIQIEVALRKALQTLGPLSGM